MSTSDLSLSNSVTTSEKPSEKFSKAFKVIEALAIIAAFIAVFQPPYSISNTDGESSWQLAIAYLSMHHFRDGIEWIFTYGPFGGLAVGTYLPGNYWLLIIGHLLITIALLYSLWQFSQRFETLWFRPVFIILGAIPFNRISDAGCDVLVLLAGLNLLLGQPQSLIRTDDSVKEVSKDRSGSLGSPFSLIAGAIILAAMALTRFTLAVPAIFIALLLQIQQLRMAFTMRSYRPLIWSSLVWLLVFIVGFWVASGQRVGDLAAYISSSIQVSTGYNANQSFAGPAHELIPGFIACISLLVAIAAAWRGSKERRVDIALLFASILFIVWKHGFVRHDRHCVIFFFVACIICMALIPAFKPVGRMRRIVISALVIASMMSIPVLTIAEIALYGPPHHRIAGLKPWMSAVAHGVVERPFEVTHVLLQPMVYENKLAKDYEQIYHEYDLPKVKATVGRATVDVFSKRLALAIINGLNYKPRLAFQSYNANTAALANHDGEYFAASDAPEYILMQLDTLDERYPTLDDAPALNWILNRYKIMFEEKGFLLMKRMPATALAAPIDAGEVKTKIGEWTSLPVSEGYTYATISLHRRPLCGLRTLIFQAPIFYAEFKLDDGSVLSKRIVPPAIDNGFLLSPYVATNDDLVSLYQGHKLHKVTALRVIPVKGQGVYLDAEVTMHFKTAHNIVGYPTH